jgi:hypothetical protein
MYHHPSNSINGYNTPSTRQRTNSNNTRRSTSQQYPPSRPLQLEQILQNPSYQRSVFSILELRERRRNASSAASRPSPENEGTWQLDNAYSIREANRPENVDRNRWLGDLEPYDRTRVKFPPNEMGEERYLNANWVREVNGGRWWIAAQVRSLQLATRPKLKMLKIGAFTTYDARILLPLYPPIPRRTTRPNYNPISNTRWYT